MRHSPWVLCLVIAVVCLAQTPLTNDAVISMAKAGLGDEVIIIAVDSQPGKYAIGADDLIALKSAGVSDKIIVAMMAKAGATPSATAPAPQAATAAADLATAGFEPPCAVGRQPLPPAENGYERFYVGIPFGDGLMMSIRLSNSDSKERIVHIERYAARGCLLEALDKSVPPGGSADARLDLSQPRPAMGWIRLTSESKRVSASATQEVIRGNTLTTARKGSGIFREPRGRPDRLGHRWTADLAKNPAALYYFVNLSDQTIPVGMCQSDRPGFSCSMDHAVAPLAQVVFRLDPAHRYAVIQSGTGYSAASMIRFVDGDKKAFGAMSSVTFGDVVDPKR